MDYVHQITIFLPGKDPVAYRLDRWGKNCVRLGRGPTHGDETADRNDICIDTRVDFVSRAQCSFYFRNGSWIVVDDNSTNGMSFQNASVRSHVLHDGDKLVIGVKPEARLVMMYSRRAADAAATNPDKHPLPASGRIIIGRDPGCDIVLTHPTASRRHCVITCENGSYYVADNASRNGVILNGRTMHGKELLHPMDKLTIADQTFVFSDNCLYSMRLAGGVSVSAVHLSKTVGRGGKAKRITSDVSLSIAPNEFVAIVGGSGAGKTTLLNCLSGMAGFTEGEVYINGESIRSSAKSLKSLMGYVPQQDIVYNDLTLERMLLYAAKLRMPQDTSEDEIYEKIDETLRTVELDEHRRTLIGKLSGGQRKRASIAVELLASPKLFFLDEPSSGLDPGTEKHLMQMLKRLSMSGKTVIMVTHSVQNINLCDRLICMGKGGRLCFSGPPAEAPAFFGVRRMTDIYDSLNEDAERVSERFAASARLPEYAGAEALPGEGKERRSFRPAVVLRQYGVMSLRYMETIKNNTPRMLLLLLMPVLLSFLVCIAFQADGNLYNILGQSMDRKSFPFLVAGDTMSILFAFACAAFWVGIFNSIQEISRERAIYEREAFTGVSPLAYVLSKFTVLTLLCLLQSLIMCALLAWLSSTTATVDGDIHSVTAMEMHMGSDGVVFGSGGLWPELLATTFLNVLSAMCLGLVISSLVSNEMALVICPVCLLPQILFSGVTGPLTGITKSISKIISCRWSCIAYYTSAGINDLYGSCSYADVDGWVTEAIDTESGIIDVAYDKGTSYLFGCNPVTSAWLAFGIISLVCIILSILALRFRRVRLRA